MIREKQRRANRRIGKPAYASEDPQRSPTPEPSVRSQRKRVRRKPKQEASTAGSVEPLPQRPSFGWAWTACKILLGVMVVVGAAGVVAFGAHHFATTTSRFAIRVIKVEGSRHYNRAELAQMAGTARGSNLFALDLAAAERNLVEDPWIKSASVSRQLPNALRIVVEEHTAAALSAIDGSLYFVTREGYPVKALETGESADYPVITGITTEELAVDRVAAETRMAAAIRVLRLFERLKLAKAFPAQEIHLASDGRITLTVGKQAIALELGKTRFRQKLLMAGRIVSKTRSRGETPGIIFLDNAAHPERVVVRLR